MTHPSEDSTRNDDVQRVIGDVTNRLAELGISLSGDEQPHELVRILEAVERFEVAVQSRGGDLMVDEGPEGQTTEPDDPHFALPRRRADESVERYLDRLVRVTDDVMGHPPKQ